MATIAAVHQSQKSLESLLLQKMNDFEAQLKATLEPTSLVRLSEDFKTFKEYVYSILQLLQQQIAELSRVTDVLEMRHRRKCLLLGGIPEVVEGKENAPDTVCNILKTKFQLQDISTADFKACHRLGTISEGRPRPILVNFVNHSTKSSVWNKKKCLKGSSLVLSEFITRRRQALFQEARKRYGITKCWTMDGSIFVKPPTGKPININSESDFDKVAEIIEAARESQSLAQEDSSASDRSHKQGRIDKPGPSDKVQRPKRAIKVK